MYSHNNNNNNDDNNNTAWRCMTDTAATAQQHNGQSSWSPRYALGTTIRRLGLRGVVRGHRNQLDSTTGYPTGKIIHWVVYHEDMKSDELTHDEIRSSFPKRPKGESGGVY